jgi:hypothetical protein
MPAKDNGITRYRQNRFLAFMVTSIVGIFQSAMLLSADIGLLSG